MIIDQLTVCTQRSRWPLRRGAFVRDSVGEAKSTNSYIFLENQNWQPILHICRFPLALCQMVWGISIIIIVRSNIVSNLSQHHHHHHHHNYTWAATTSLRAIPSFWARLVTFLSSLSFFPKKSSLDFKNLNSDLFFVNPHIRSKDHLSLALSKM